MHLRDSKNLEFADAAEPLTLPLLEREPARYVPSRLRIAPFPDRDMPRRPAAAAAAPPQPRPFLYLPMPPSKRGLNPAGKKHRFGKAWMHEHVNDAYVQEAKARGYRSRAAFKLIELAEKDRLFRPGTTAIDLGAAPGSWTQVLRERLGPRARIAAVDLLPIEPLPGVEVIEGDLAEEATLARLESWLAGGRADLVVSDMAPNLSGVEVADQARSIHLAEVALDLAGRLLQPGGDLVVKVFQGSGLIELQRTIAGQFEKVYVRKPKASRDRSREIYLVAKGFHGVGEGD